MNKFTDKIIEKYYLDGGLEIWSKYLISPNANLIIKEYAKNIVDEYLEVAKDSLEQLYKICQSPIEVSFIEALICICLQNHYQISFDFDAPGNPTFEGDFPCELKVTPQWKFKKFRADFLLEFTTPDFENDVTKNVIRKVIVECDGHDFHDRTKEQVQRDKTRDRAFTASGIPVLRFTGSELFADPFQAAKETLKFLEFSQF